MASKLKTITLHIISAIFWACALVFLLVTLFLSFNKFFTIDEFQYAHAAWLCAHGMVPYRDFFDHHFPFLYQIFSVFFIFSNNPLTILYLRAGMILFLILDFCAIWLINSKYSRNYLSSLLGIVFLLCCWPFITRALEIRPDSMAFALFFCSLAVVCFHKKEINIPPFKRFCHPFTAGMILALAVWSSQKVLVYGAPIALFLLVDFISYHQKKRGNSLFGNPYHFLNGSMLVGFIILGYLFLTRSLVTMWFWCIMFPMEMQAGFQGFSWAKHFFPGFGWYFWVIPLFLVGWISSLIRLKKEWVPIEVLLLTLPFFAFLSYIIQVAPYDYSLIPFYAVFALYAGRGGGFIIEKLVKSTQLPNLIRFSALVCFIISIMIAVLLNLQTFARFMEDNNASQLQVLKQISTLTEEDEVFFDNTGNFVSRPHAYYFYYNFPFMREDWQIKFTKEIPEAVFDSKCTWLFEDDRSAELPEPVISFLLAHFVRYSPELWVWGRKFYGKGTFKAIKNGKYFIYPEDVLEGNDIRLGDKKIKKQIFSLAEGYYRVSSKVNKEFYIIYLPADGKTFKPDKDDTISTFVR